MRAIAAREGKQLHVAIDQALREFIEKKKRGEPRSNVFTAFGESVAEYDALYKALAK